MPTRKSNSKRGGDYRQTSSHNYNTAQTTSSYSAYPNDGYRHSASHNYMYTSAAPAYAPAAHREVVMPAYAKTSYYQPGIFDKVADFFGRKFGKKDQPPATGGAKSRSSSSSKSKQPRAKPSTSRSNKTR